MNKGVGGYQEVINNCSKWKCRLSHLASLMDPRTPPEKRRAQIENGEEHLRRAILEPYFIVLGRDRKQSRLLLERYEAELLPVKHEYPTLADAPEMNSINARIQEVARLTKKGRAAKAMNLWDPRALAFQRWRHSVILPSRIPVR
jgi:anti-sigma-K factor RskA